jgi:hypothetical protein
MRQRGEEMRDARRSSCYMRYFDCVADVLLLQVIFGKVRSRNYQVLYQKNVELVPQKW